MLIFAALAAFAAAQLTSSSSLPIVDLGYELHQALYYNESANFYNFTNIRFAQPPLGELRFSPPANPTTDRSTVRNGSEQRVCPGALPNWWITQESDVFEYLYGINVTWAGAVGGSGADESEDCLFLDVIVPKPVFDSAGTGKGVPVLVWIYGAAYTTGSKSGSASGPVGGLLRRGNNDFVFVAINYRLGAFGWLSGPTFQKNDTPNVGLLDQRFALAWVQKYIHLFGGDKNRVTLMGESSGGGSILHQITAYGGREGPPPFQRAILQSGGFVPVVSDAEQESTFQQFLSLLNVTTLQEARRLPSSDLIAANYAQISSNNVVGTTTYGPVVDGSFVPALPGLLLLHGQFYHDVSIMTGYNQNDDLIFTNLTIAANETSYASLLTSLVPDIEPAALAYISNTLYPPVFDGSYGYTSPIQRAAMTIQDLFIQCNTLFLAKAKNNQTYNYVFAVPPALHGMDVSYTFYDDEGASAAVENPQVAIAMQHYFTSFVETGAPIADGQPEFGTFGGEGNLMVFNITGVSVGTEGSLEWKRCAWWQEALWE